MIALIRLALCCALLAVSPAVAQEMAPPASAAPQSAPKALDELTLDELFERLAQSQDARAGKAAEAEILSRLHESGSHTADLLLSWASQSIEEKKYQLALDVLDQLILLKPDFAEGWNKRATVHYLLDDYSGALADIRQTLALEPRHFGALSGLGLILEDTGREDQAIAVFRKVLAINPQLEQIRETLERLEKATAGNAI